jgi:hypothetical protein
MTSLHVPVRIAHLIADGKVRRTRLRPTDRDIEPWRRGRSYAVIPYGKPAICRVIVDAVETIEAGDQARTHELRVEGYKTLADLARQWLRGSRIDDVSDADLLRIFEAKHAHRPAVLLGFRLDTSHRPRLLDATRIGAYTEDPMQAVLHEPEAVPEFVDDRQVHDARERRDTGAGEIERRILAELKDLDGRLERLTAADLRGASDATRSAVRVIRQRIASLEGRRDRAA